MILGAVLVSFSPHPIFGPNIQSGSRGRTRNKLPQFPRNLKNFNPDYFGFVFGFRVLTMLRDIYDMLVVLPFVGIRLWISSAYHAKGHTRYAGSPAVRGI